MTDNLPRKKAIPKPAGLGLKGSRMWKRVISGYVFRPDELFLLEMCCRTADTIASLEAAMAGEPLLVRGSMGQMREHPLLSEARQQRAALARFLRQLNLPEEDNLVGAARAGERSAAARELASTRWSRRGHGDPWELPGAN